MKKNNQYEKWHKLKCDINNKNPNLFPKEKEVWVMYFGKNVGYEQNGSGSNFIRPCLVLKKFNNKMFWVIPLSSKQKDLDFYLNFMDNNFQKVSLIIAQLRLISVNRFDRKMYEIKTTLFNEIKNKVFDLLS